MLLVSYFWCAELFPSSADARSLRRATRRVLDVFEDRVRRTSRLKFILKFFKLLDIDRCDLSLARFFNDDFKIVGVDGSYATEERLELLLLYVCAAGYSCWVKIGGGHVVFDVFKAVREDALRVSASIPLWLEDLPNVNPSSLGAASDFDVRRSIESVPYALMTLAELWLAYKAISNNDVRVVLLDRLLSGTYGPASRDLRLLLRRGFTVLTGSPTPYGEVSMLDLHLAGFLGSGQTYVPPRGAYGAYALIKLLIDFKRKDRAVRKSEIPALLGVSVAEAKRFLRRVRRLDEHYDGQLLEFDVDDRYLSVRGGVENYWKRVWFTTEKFIYRIFGGTSDHPLMIEGDNRWITTLDINALNVFLIHRLIDYAVGKGKLVIGIVKDTNATDVIRAVLPVWLKLTNSSHSDNKLPSTLRSDRALLSMVSAANFDIIPTPWRSVEYDACFATMIRDEECDKLNVIARAARKTVFREQLFIRGYFQLRSLKSDPSIRSAVFLYDRPFSPKFDSKLVVNFNCLERNGASVVKPFLEVRGRSFIGNLVLYILSQCDNPNVIEEMGHNHLLFLADKLVKVWVKRAKTMLRGIANLDLISVTSKYKAYFSSRRFRDIRSEAERTRERFVREEYE